jgi:hypothetical protein
MARTTARIGLDERSGAVGARMLGAGNGADVITAFWEQRPVASGDPERWAVDVQPSAQIESPLHALADVGGHAGRITLYGVVEPTAIDKPEHRIIGRE